MAAFLGLIIVALFYFLPTIIGHKKRRAMALFWLNLLGGWTGVGWLVAFIWALTKDAVLSEVSPIAPATVVPVSRSAVARTTITPISHMTVTPASVPDSLLPPPAPLPPASTPTGQPATKSLASELERLFQLKEDGVLTETEYALSKTKLLA